jgi:hypothetical protein
MKRYLYTFAVEINNSIDSEKSNYIYHGRALCRHGYSSSRKP